MKAFCDGSINGLNRSLIFGVSFNNDFSIAKLVNAINLTSQLKTEQLKYEKLLSEFNQFKESVNSSKLLSIGLCIVNGLAKPSDLANLNVLNDDQVDLDSDKVC